MINNSVVKILIIFIIIWNMFFMCFQFTTYATESELIIEKISNPNSGAGDVDGLENDGNRETSYAWAMATRGDYVYIGTNKNIVGNVVQTFINTITNSFGISEDMAWDVVSNMTNEEIPRPTTEEGGHIFKCNIHTGEIVKLFTADKGVSFRMAIEHDGDLYFASYAAENIGATDTTQNVKNYIYKIDENDKITSVFESTGGASMRAACIYNESLLFGGIDEKSIIAEADKEYTKLAIIKKDQEDDTLWTRIADYKDFIEYATDPALTNSAGSPIWDMCSYDGYVWAVIPGRNGFVMFKGRPANQGELSNEYGWIWEEVIGKTNGINNVGLAPVKEGYIEDLKGIISSAATPFVYKDKLYLFDFDMTITAEVNAAKGLLLKIAGQNPRMSEYLNTMYNCLKHPQSLWCYNNETGIFNKVEGFNKYMNDTCNEYIWRYGIYNDELYITTMDSAVMYRYITTLVGSDFVKMTDEELDIFIDNIKKYIETAGGIEELDKIIIMLEEYKTVKDKSEIFSEFVVKNEKLFMELESFLQKGIQLLDEEISSLEQDLSKIDISGLKMYAYIVRHVKNDILGFDMLKTTDGINFEVILNNGFGDPYNYGGRSLITTSEGLYVGTANPFYGAQLWRLRKVIQDDTVSQEPTNPDDSEEKKEPVDDTIAPGILPDTGTGNTNNIVIVIFAIATISQYIKYIYRKVY